MLLHRYLWNYLVLIFALFIPMAPCVPKLAESPIHIVKPLEPVTSATENDDVAFECEVSKPDVPGAWFKDDLEILPEVDEKYDVILEGVTHGLTVHEVMPDDEAEYTLEIGKESTTTKLVLEGTTFANNPLSRETR